jgi:hypothetical protein
MRTLVLAVIVVATGAARADRATSVSVGGLMNFRDNAPEGSTVAEPEVSGGARVTLWWDDPFVAPAQGNAVSARLVPELLIGFLSTDHYAEGELGAGLRGELQLATRAPLRLRVGFYGAIRGEVIGKDRDPAGELVVGEYFPIGARLRIGFDGGVAVRHDSVAMRNQLEAIVHCYVGWML